MPINSDTTRMPNGVTNAAPWQTMADSGSLDPSWNQTFFVDFTNLTTVLDFTSTIVGAGTNVLTSTLGGAVLMTTTAGVADANYMQTPQATFQLRPGFHHFFKCSIQLSTSATSPDAFAGLISASAVPLAAPDGIFFWKQAGGTTIIVRSIIGGVPTDLVLPVSQFPVVGAYAEVGLHIDANGGVSVFRNPTTGATVPVAANGARGRVGFFAPTLTQALLTPSFGIRNGGAGAQTLLVDYILAQSNR